MKINVAAGAAEGTVELTVGGTVGDLRALAQGLFGAGIADAPVMINGVRADETTPVPEDAEVEFARRDGAKA